MIKDDNYFRNALNRINEVLPIRAGLHNKIKDVPCDVGQYAIEMAKLRALQVSKSNKDDCIAQQIAELEGHAYLDDEDLIAAQEQITDASNIAYEIGRQADGMIIKERESQLMFLVGPECLHYVLYSSILS